MKKLFWLLTTLLALVGVVTIYYRLQEGMKVTALSSTVAWGMWVAFYIYFIGLSAGSFLLSTLIYVFGMHKLEKAGKMALLSALFALFGGLLFVWMDLGHPWRFWRVFLNWNYTSVLAWESAFYILYIIIIFAELWHLMRCDLSIVGSTEKGFKGAVCRALSLGFICPTDKEEHIKCHKHSLRIVKVLGIIGIPVAIGVHGGTGALFAVVAAKPYWYGPLFPIIFLVSALVSGAALTTFLYTFFGPRDEDYESMVRSLGKFLVLFISIDVLLMISEFLTNLYAGIPDHEKVLHQILFGDFWYTFWIGQLLLGVIIPILSLIFSKNSVKIIGLGGLSAVIGIVAVRLNLIVPAYIVPMLPGLDKAYVNPRWQYYYFPSIWEWATSVGAVALIVWGFALAWHLLPVLDVEKELK